MAGAGVSNVAYGLVAREIERVDSGYRSMMSVQSSLVMYPIYAYGNDEQRRKYLRKLSTGEYVGCFGLTEPDAGSDPGAMDHRRGANRRRLQAARVEDLDLEFADRRRLRHLGEVARASEQGSRLHPGKGNARAFSPENRRKALAAGVLTGEIAMDDVEAPESALLPDASGLQAAFNCLNRARYGIAWGVMGAAEDCLHRARQYALDRKQFGRPLAATQLVQKKLADMQTEIALGLQAALRARPSL